jgi:uncharacterized protein (TIGR02145 family)
MKSNSKLLAIMLTAAIFGAASCTKDDPPGPEDPTHEVPVITTAGISNIEATAATSGGAITSDGGVPITARGVCWSTNPLPTVASSKTTDGTGPGSFTSNITGLNAGTKYYVRAYATNSIGTAYGDEQSFTTQAPVSDMTDIDGNVYKVVKIGTQIWMAENLKVTHYKDGTLIPEVQAVFGPPVSWLNMTTGGWCYYNNDAANNTAYGKLYNWHAVNSGKLAPQGWHVPTDAEWITLVNYLGGFQLAGGKMKATTLWNSPNTGADNSSGFAAVPGGGRGGSNGSLAAFGSIGVSGIFWSSTPKEGGAWYYSMDYLSTMVTTNYEEQRSGLSVRCVKD